MCMYAKKHMFVHIQRPEESGESLRVGIKEGNRTSNLIYGCLNPNSGLYDCSPSAVNL